MIHFLVIKQGINKKFVQPIRLRRRRKKFRDRPLSIIASNCIGGGLSHDFGWKFCSPTINLYLGPNDYLDFASHLKEYLELPLEFSHMGHSEKEYPIGKIVREGGRYILIHFLHYGSFEEAKAKWDARKARIDWDRLLLLFTDQNGCTDEHLRTFDRLPYPKLLFVGTSEFGKTLPYAVPIQPTRRERQSGENPVDHAMIFRGFSGLRRYESGFDIENFVKNYT